MNTLDVVMESHDYTFPWVSVTKVKKFTDGGEVDEGIPSVPPLCLPVLPSGDPRTRHKVTGR